MLRRQAEWLAQHRSAKVAIEGHADERGTREYNLALGDRRAFAVSRYLLTLGVLPEQIVKVVSYGKERPDALGTDESAWRLNRRIPPR